MDKPEFIICPKCGAEVQYSKYFNSYSCLTMFCDWASFDPSLNKDTHVYCTDCKWFKVLPIGTEIWEVDEIIPYCPFEDECDIDNCEDSMRFEDRPCWESKY